MTNDKPKRTLIAPAGWEQRYVESVLHDVSEMDATQVVVPYSSRHSQRTTHARSRIEDRCNELGISFHSEEWNYDDQVSLYNSTKILLESYIESDYSLRLNVTTTPRNIIWYFMHCLGQKNQNFHFSYYRPQTYGDYLSRDAMPPKLVLKASGISYPDKPTCILALSGFDSPRLLQLLQWYEPRKMIIGVQTGVQFSNDERNVANVAACKRMLGGVAEFIEFDNYDTSDTSVYKLINTASRLTEDYNVIAASLGPKPSAVNLFKLHKILPEVGLVYIGAKDYDENYSSGFTVENRLVDFVEWASIVNIRKSYASPL